MKKKKIISQIIGIATGIIMIGQCTTTAGALSNTSRYNMSASEIIRNLKNNNNNNTNHEIFYSQSDFEAICYIVQSEVGNCSQASKIAVTNVILNRVKDNRFPNSIIGVITQKNQFTSVSNYYNKTNKPSQDTINCVRRALNGENNSIGALYFYNPRYCSYNTRKWFESLIFCFELDGQRYFKN